MITALIVIAVVAALPVVATRLTKTMELFTTMDRLANLKRVSEGTQS